MRTGYLPIKVPSTVATLRTKSISPDSRKTLVIVQQVHTSEEMQENIFQLCRILYEQEGFDFITAEGDDTKLEAHPQLRTIEESVNASTTVSAGVLKFVDTFGEMVHVWGCDRLDLIETSREIMLQLGQLGEAREIVFRKIRAMLLLAQANIYAEDVARLRKIAVKLYEIDGNLIEQITLIKQISKRVNLNIEEFPSVATLSRSLELERIIDFKRVEQQREDFVRDVVDYLFSWYSHAERTRYLDLDVAKPFLRYWLNTQNINDEEFLEVVSLRRIRTVLREYQDWFQQRVVYNARDMVFDSKGFSAGPGQAQYLNELMQIGDEIGITQNKYKDLRLYIDYLYNSTTQLSAEVLLEEIPECGSILIDKLDDPDAIRLRDLEDEFQALYRAIRLEMTPTEHEIQEVKVDRLAELTQYLCEIVGDPNFSEIRRDISKLRNTVRLANDFGTQSDMRANHMLKRTLELMDKYTVERCVLVAGGFHTRRIMRMLEYRRNITWYVYAPKFDFDRHARSHFNSGRILP